MYIQLLEPRLLFVKAPPTLLGISAAIKITGGSAPLPNSGSYTIEFSTLSRSYKVIGGTSVAKSDGIYSYHVLQGKVGELKANDSVDGQLTLDFTFIAPTNGTLKVVRKGGGAEAGTFALTGPNFAFVQGRVLIIHGTSDPDSIGVTQLAAHDITVTRNNITQNFDEFEGDACIITSDAGNDTVRADTLNFPTTVDAGPGNDFVSTGPLNDTVTGGDGRNTINGGNGPDLIFGGAGADRIHGNGGNDTINGGGSNDRLFGDAGNDTLIGSVGVDSISGGSGKDAADDDRADYRSSIEAIL
jgi:Ca2+-binding RTX toxin-like protein